MRVPRLGCHCSMGFPASAAFKSKIAGQASSTMYVSVRMKSWIMVGAARATENVFASLPEASI